MKSKKLTMGEICLDDYVTESEELSEERKQEIDGLLKQIGNNPFTNEKSYFAILKIQRKQYPTIDPCFLSMSNFIDYKGQEIQIPKFSVYKKQKYKNGFDDFLINIRTEHPDTFDYRVHLEINKGNENLLPEILRKPLLKSTEFYDNSRFSMIFKISPNNVPRKIWKKYKKICSGEDIKFVSGFRGIFPPKAKEKIREATQIFNDNLYLVAETKPEEWSTTRFIKDLLLIGISKDKCYLVDQLKTTSIEDKIKELKTKDIRII